MIEPYYESDDGAVKLFHGDCLSVMRGMEAGSVDAVITDPPYGHANHSGDLNDGLNQKRGIESQPIANDTPEEYRDVMDGMLTEAVRILNADCCCCCCCCGGGGPKPTFAWLAERMDRAGLQFFHSVIWDKLNPGLGWRYRRQHEMVMVAHRTGGKLRWSNPDLAVPNIVKAFPPRDRSHPNEKPVALMGRFVEWHTYLLDVVLDPFMGSGTTGVACVKTGRKFIGIEIDEHYCEIAKKRIIEAQAQCRLVMD